MLKHDYLEFEKVFTLFNQISSIYAGPFSVKKYVLTVCLLDLILSLFRCEDSMYEKTKQHQSCTVRTMWPQCTKKTTR